MQLKHTIGLALLTAFALAGCAGPGDEADDGPQVAMKGNQFVPQQITVASGAAVTWTNQDAAPHDVSSDTPFWTSPGGMGGMAKGATFTRPFDGPGTYDYYCQMHSPGPGTGMWGRVVVT